MRLKGQAGTGSFNGATLFQAWRARCYCQVVKFSCQLQWGHAFQAWRDSFFQINIFCRHPSFNGATLFQAWRAVEVARGARAGGASMGPRFFKRGEPIKANSLISRSTRFNGATLFQAWRASVWLMQRGASLALQWGHAFSSVERPIPCRGHTTAYNASMGPRFFKRGESSPGRSHRRRPKSFNGATLFQAWRALAAPPPAPAGGGFNGATLFQAWRATSRTAMAASESRFNGATLFQAWRVLRRQRALHPQRRFNGATLFQAWRGLIALWATMAIPLASMGPRFFKRGEPCARLA